MKMRHLLPISLGIILVVLSATSAYAEPTYSSGGLLVGNQFVITTIRGEARTWIDGHWLTAPANLQLQVQVTFAGPYNVVFRVLSGTFQVNDKTYAVDSGHWRGDYNLETHTTIYQGPATAPNGGTGYFVLYAQDTGAGSPGVFMNISSDFLGEYGSLWHVQLSAYRYGLG